MSNEENKIVEVKEDVKTEVDNTQPIAEEKVETEVKADTSKEDALHAELETLKKEHADYKSKYEKLGAEQLEALDAKTQAIEKKMNKTKLETL